MNLSLRAEEEDATGESQSAARTEDRRGGTILTRLTRLVRESEKVGVGAGSER